MNSDSEKTDNSSESRAIPKRKPESQRTIGRSLVKSNDSNSFSLTKVKTMLKEVQARPDLAYADKDSDSKSLVPWFKCRICFCQVCGCSCGTLVQMAIMGGLWIVLMAIFGLTTGIASPFLCWINIFAGLWVILAAACEAKGATRYGKIMVMTLTVVMGIYIVLRLWNIPRNKYATELGKFPCLFHYCWKGDNNQMVQYPGHMELSQPRWFKYVKETLAIKNTMTLIMIIAFSWALGHLFFIGVIFCMHYSYREMQRYDNYWLLQRFPNLPRAESVIKKLPELTPENRKYLRTVHADKYENLVLAGGGAKGIVTIGALYALEQAGILDNIKRYCGTSVGSILTTMMATNISVEEMLDLVIECDMGSVIPPAYTTMLGGFLFCIPCRVFMQAAIPGATRKMSLRLKYMLRKLTGNENITLSEFQKMFGTELSICVTNSTTSTTEFLCADTHPDMPVYLALRASSAIPLAFKPVKWQGNTYFDGGCVANYPVWAYDGSRRPKITNRDCHILNPKTIGINFNWGQYDVGSKLVHRADIDDLSSETSVSTVSAMEMKVNNETKKYKVKQTQIEQYLNINIAPKAIVKSQRISDRTTAIPAPNALKLKMADQPESTIGGTAFSVVGDNFLALYNTQDRPRDIHRTVLLNDPPVDTLQFNATRSVKTLVTCMTEGMRSSLAFFKGNYILKQKVHELAMKKNSRISYYQKPKDHLSPRGSRSASPPLPHPLWRHRSDLSDQHSDEDKFTDMEILRADLMMTGILPDELNLQDENVKKRLVESGYLAYRMHIALQPPSHLPTGVCHLKYLDQFLHFDVPTAKNQKSYLHESFPEARPPSRASHGSIVRINPPLFDALDSPRQGSFTDSSGPSIFGIPLNQSQRSLSALSTSTDLDAYSCNDVVEL